MEGGDGVGGSTRCFLWEAGEVTLCEGGETAVGGKDLVLLSAVAAMSGDWLCLVGLLAWWLIDGCEEFLLNLSVSLHRVGSWDSRIVSSECDVGEV